ncbi:MAG: hypothetical protein M5R36_17365 [Deltaproteobacteria bacterium]|nr:hypothetical protein [Deltaproteobacteria bacterium]
MIAVFARPARAAGRFSLLPNLAAWWEWNDNILLEAEESEADKIEDQSGTVQPGLALLYDSYRTQARLAGAAAFQWYLETTEENRLPNLITGTFLVTQWLDPSTRVEVFDNLSFFYDPRDNLGQTAAEVISVRSASISNSIGANVERSFTRTTRLRAEYSFNTTEYDEPILFDVVTHAAALSWFEAVSEQHTIVVFGRFARNLYDAEFDFLRRFVDEDATMKEDFPTSLERPSDFDTYIPGLGVDYHMTEGLTFSVRSGLTLPARGDRRGLPTRSDRLVSGTLRDADVGTVPAGRDVHARAGAGAGRRGRGAQPELRRRVRADVDIAVSNATRRRVLARAPGGRARGRLPRRRHRELLLRVVDRGRRGLPAL